VRQENWVHVRKSELIKLDEACKKSPRGKKDGALLSHQIDRRNGEKPAWGRMFTTGNNENSKKLKKIKDH